MQTQKRGRSGLIFSSPVTSATASAPTLLDHALIDLAREQAQRQADHPGGMGEHPLDGEMGLAGIGRAEHGRDAIGAGGGRQRTKRKQGDEPIISPAHAGGGVDL